MEAPAIAVAPSTATESTPQVPPEAAPQKPNAAKEAVSVDSLIQKAIEKAKAKQENPGTQPETEGKAESNPGEKPTEETPSENGEDLEVVSHNGKEVPLMDILKDGSFEVFANGEYKTVDGLDKLMDMASIGFAATKKVENAKQVVLKANDLIREFESNTNQQAQKIATDYLNNLLDQVTNGGVNPATGKPFQNKAERQGAVELANRLINENANSAKPSQQSLTREEIEELVEKKAEEKLKMSEKQKAEERVQQETARIAQIAENSLQKATEPLMQYFTGADDKTLNKPLFNSYKAEVKAKADELWSSGGKPSDSAGIEKLISQAAKVVLEDWKPSLKSSKAAESLKAPVTSTTSGMPLSSNGKPKYKSFEDAISQKIKSLRAGQRAS